MKQQQQNLNTAEIATNQYQTLSSIVESRRQIHKQMLEKQIKNAGQDIQKEQTQKTKFNNTYQRQYQDEEKEKILVNDGNKVSFLTQQRLLHDEKLRDNNDGLGDFYFNPQKIAHNPEYLKYQQKRSDEFYEQLQRQYEESQKLIIKNQNINKQKNAFKKENEITIEDNDNTNKSLNENADVDAQKNKEKNELGLARLQSIDNISIISSIGTVMFK